MQVADHTVGDPPDHLPASVNRPDHVQSKLKIGRPGDKYEREADAVADRVMMMPLSPVPDPPMTGHPDAPARMTPAVTDPELQMKCEECEDRKEEKIQMEPARSSVMMAAADEEDESSIQMKPDLWRALDTGLNTEMGRNTGTQTFTHENNAYRKEGKFDPGYSSGKHLLSHGLTPVVKPNDMIQRAVQESDIEGGVQQFSTHCGWIDWPHADPANSTHIIQEVRNAGPGHIFTARWQGNLHNADLNIQILTDMANADQDLQNGVSLGIFQMLSYMFEISQMDVEAVSAAVPFLGYRSSFSVEDLPSNLIGFYRAIHGLSQEDVCRICWCWNRQASLDRFNSDEDRGALEPYNVTFEPLEYFEGGSWPNEFSSIQPVRAGQHWRIVGGNLQNTVTMAGDLGRALLSIPRPTMPVTF